MKARLRVLGNVVSQTWLAYRRHDGAMLSGAVAFFAILATAPFGVIAVVVAGAVVGREVAREDIEQRVGILIGEEQATFFMDVADRASEHPQTYWATFVSVAFIVITSARLFLTLRSALNHVFRVSARSNATFKMRAFRNLRKNVLAFVMVVLVGFAMLVGAFAKSWLQYASHFFDDVPRATRVLEFIAMQLVLSFLIAIAFRVLPDARLRWRDAYLGASVTSLLAGVGGYIIGAYLTHASPGSTYGAAGSLVVVLLWVYYSAQIFFVGAHFTRVYAELHGGGIEPLPHAARVVEADSSLIGLPPKA